MRAYGFNQEGYSDIGEAKVLARECISRLRFTSATDYITFQGDRWHEDKQKSLGTVEDFMDAQLTDANEAIRIAEEALISIGVSETDVKGRTKDLPKMVPIDKMGMLYALIGADTYKKFVMKYRNYKNIVNTQNAAKPMLAIDVSELDYDPELLNTPGGTYDLTKGLDGAHAHDPDDLITKVTAVAPGDKGRKLWEDSLSLFFCGDKELIDYVQEIVGMAAVGKVYAEHMIIAYGGGANGKSTFWNTIARVLGNYSGKLSAEALTTNCKRNKTYLGTDFYPAIIDQKTFDEVQDIRIQNAKDQNRITLSSMKMKRLLFDASLESTLKEQASGTLQTALNEIRLRPAVRDTNGTLVRFRAFSRMKSTWVICFLSSLCASRLWPFM